MSDHLRGYGWRHATWCRWEKAEGTCDCGLREHQDAASPPAAPLDVWDAETMVIALEKVVDANPDPPTFYDLEAQLRMTYVRLTRAEEQG